VTSRRDERGLSESVQHAVIFPVLMLVTLGIIQAGIWTHGHTVALRAASAAVDIARGSHGSSAEAREMATGVTAAGGLRRVVVSVSTGNGRAEVTVSGEAPVLIDFGLGQVSEHASAPLERVSQP
jgi:Flp pilus assembly protein TadG